MERPSSRDYKIIFDEETNLCYHAEPIRPYKPIYKERFIELGSFLYTDSAIAKDEKGWFLINKKGNSLIGDTRYPYMKKHIIREITGMGKLDCGTDIYVATKENKNYLILFHMGKWHTLLFGNRRFNSSYTIYYKSFGLLLTSYRKISPSLPSRAYTSMLIDIVKKKQVGIKANRSTVVDIDSYGKIFGFTEHRANGESVESFALVSENFENMYFDIHAAQKAALSFDYITRNETIQL